MANEDANIGVVIGFIVTAIVLSLGVVILYQVQFLSVKAGERISCNPNDCKHLGLVHYPELTRNDNPEWVRSPCHHPSRKSV